MEKVNCNLCDSSRKTLLLESRNWLNNTKEYFNLMRCDNCGLVYLSPRPTKKLISSYYPDTYEPYNAEGKNTAERLSRNLLDGYYKKKKNILDYTKSILTQLIYSPIPNDTPGKILDVGCGPGISLYNLKKFGWEVHGLDISQKAVSFAINNLGLKNVKRGFIEDTSYPEAYFDVIRMSHVIEHLGNPKKALLKIKKNLKKNGTLIITTPDFSSPFRSIFGPYWFPLESPRHFYLFTPKTISLLLGKVGGLKIFKTKHDISAYYLAKSLSYVAGNKPIVNKALMILKIFFIPLTFLLSLVGKADVATYYIKKEDK